VRVDSGGALNGALLRAGLVDEVSLLVHPVLAGDAPRWYGSPPPGPLALEPMDGGAPDWLRYRVASP
jgi:2,5-diamino-6-(ribosylamino)-4(3H)-pyrimidinone 5'-phosphate reductase